MTKRERLTGKTTAVHITDINGVSVGHASDDEALTGVTVILAPEGMTGGVDVSGFASSTRQIDALSPHHIVHKIHGVCIAGGSAYGLDSASGVMDYLEEKNAGFNVRVARIPIVPTAVIFDLGLGSSKKRPDREMGYLACQNASQEILKEGNVGAGTGASVGKFFGIEHATKGGLGTAACALDNGLIVGAISVVNAFGDIRDPSTGKILAGARKEKHSREFADTARLMRNGVPRPISYFQNTTISVIVTNANLDKKGATVVSRIARTGMSKTVSPAHTLFDGDVVFTLASGEIEADLHTIGLAAEEMLISSIIRAVTLAREVKGVPSAFTGQSDPD